MPPIETPTLESLAERTGQLYSPPAVALEVIRLTDEPKIDARAICNCLEADPALGGKLLRVVNSSLYGMSQEIASLSQAIALLGVEPLKLLVLGFSIPDELNQSLTGDALRRYWTDTLTTATAARLIADAGWGHLGDEALAAGLMQGLGQLALLGQLGDDYADLLAATLGDNPLAPPKPIEPLEREALGFEHRQLSAELVRRWNLPPRLADAIELQSGDQDLDHLRGDEACLAQALRLANLLNRLVARRDLAALGELASLGQRYCNLSQRQINSIVDALQEKTTQLAQAMSAPLIEGIDYRQTLVEAHARLSLLSEKSAVRMLGEARTTHEIDQDEQLCKDLLLETRRLSAAVRVLLAGGLEPRTDRPETQDEAPAKPRAPHVAEKVFISPHARLVELTNEHAAAARGARGPLSLALVQVSVDSVSADPNAMSLRDWIGASDHATEFKAAVWAPVTRDRAVVWHPGIERTEANRLWADVGVELSEKTPVCLNVGVAGVQLPTKNFDGGTLLDAAERCLDGAIATAGSSVKSIEVF